MNALVVKGLYAITPECADTPTLLALVEQALIGGASVLQYRAKEATPALRREQARELVRLCDQYKVPLLINDWVDLALECGAQGVHLGGQDGSLTLARRRLPKGEWLIGVSCYHSPGLALAAQAEGADYVALGSFFTSPTKPQAKRATLEDLKAAREQVKIPLVAIGGITRDNAPSLVAAGADALAVISALFEAPDVAQAAREFCHLMEPSL